jgi:hypothetical protein
MSKTKDKVMVIDTPATNVNPFADPSKLWISQDYADQLPTKKMITTIAVRKPSPQVFFRCHPNNDYHRDFAILNFEEDRETYLITPQMNIFLDSQAKMKRLYYCMTKGGTLLLWPVSVGGGQNIWTDSAHQIAAEAQKHWIQLVSNTEMGGYTGNVPEKNWPDPEWPDLELSDVLEKAFRGRFIDREDHEVIQKLRGAV